MITSKVAISGLQSAVFSKPLAVMALILLQTGCASPDRETNRNGRGFGDDPQTCLQALNDDSGFSEECGRARTGRRVPGRRDFDSDSDRVFVKAGATAGGTGSFAAPLNSLEAVEANSAPGDVICILPSNGTLDGGIVLKDGQALIGAGNDPFEVDASQANVRITNSSLLTNDGHGVLLANNNRVAGIHVVSPQGSGIFGRNSSGAEIRHVLVTAPNASNGHHTDVFGLFGETTHSGIFLLNQTTDGNHCLSHVRIMGENPWGINVTVNDGHTVNAVMDRLDFRGAVADVPANKGFLLFGTHASDLILFARGPESILNATIDHSTFDAGLASHNRVVQSSSEDGESNVTVDHTYMGEGGNNGWLQTDLDGKGIMRGVLRNSIIENVSDGIETFPIDLRHLAHPTYLDRGTGPSEYSFLVDSCLFQNNRRRDLQLTPDGAGSAAPPANHDLNVSNSTIISNGTRAMLFGDAGVGGTYRVDLGGGALGSEGNNRIFGHPQMALILGDIDVVARNNWWGSPGGLDTSSPNVDLQPGVDGTGSFDASDYLTEDPLDDDEDSDEQ